MLKNIKPPRPIIVRKKLNTVISGIKDIALQKGPGWKIQGVRELSDQLSVSTATIYNALRELEKQGIVRCRQGSGIYVSEDANKKNIGIVFGAPDFSHSFVYQILLSAAIEKAKSHNENYSFYIDIPGMQDKSSGAQINYQLEKDIEIGKVDGILLLTSKDKEQIQWLQKHIPTVSFGNLDDLSPSVKVDYKSLVETGVDALFNKGCKRIGLITAMGFARGYGYYEDIKGYKNKIKELNLRYKETYIWDKHISREETNEEAGYRAIQEFRAQNKDIEGIVIPDDMMTRGVIVAANECGLKIGYDIKIATHANKDSPALSLYKNGLILLEIDPSEIIDKMIFSLENWMKKGIKGNEQVLIKPIKTEEYEV